MILVMLIAYVENALKILIFGQLSYNLSTLYTDILWKFLCQMCINIHPI